MTLRCACIFHYRCVVKVYIDGLQYITTLFGICGCMESTLTLDTIKKNVRILYCRLHCGYCTLGVTFSWRGVVINEPFYCVVDISYCDSLTNWYWYLINNIISDQFKRRALTLWLIFYERNGYVTMSETWSTIDMWLFAIAV